VTFYNAVAVYIRTNIIKVNDVYFLLTNPNKIKYFDNFQGKTVDGL